LLTDVVEYTSIICTLKDVLSVGFCGRNCLKVDIIFLIMSLHLQVVINTTIMSGCPTRLFSTFLTLCYTTTISFCRHCVNPFVKFTCPFLMMLMVENRVIGINLSCYLKVTTFTNAIKRMYICVLVALLTMYLKSSF
jgi:hypothetical protein